MPEVLHLSEVSPEKVLARFVEVASAGGLLIFPTDTVYGLAGRADLTPAVEALFAVKQRPAELRLPVLIGSLEELPRVVSFWPPGAAALAEAFWPGPLTLVVPAAPGLSPLVTARGDTVGVRMPDHAALRSWLSACAFPVAVTSANLSGSSPAVRPEEIPPELAKFVSLILDGGPCAGGRASTVVEVEPSGWRLLRPGPVSAEDLRRVWPA